MSYKKNAGRRRGVTGMALTNQGAIELVRMRAIDTTIDDLLEEHRRTVETMNMILPALGSTTGFGSLALLDLFNNEVMNPFAVASIAHHSASDRREERREVAIQKALADASGVPAFMLPRDNGHRQSRDETAMYDFLVISNEYKVPEIPRDKWGTPNWPADVELVSGRHPDSGEWGKLCYRTACQRPHAFYYNTGSRKHYCWDCADIINREGMSGNKLCFLSKKEGEYA
jgi:hypothetical protein